MSQYQRLLLILNPALRHSPAMNHAAALAKASGASLHVVGLVASFKWLSLLEEGDRELARQRYLLDHQDWLEAQAENLRGRSIDVTTEVLWAEDLKQDILDHVAALQPDLLIKEIQHESALKRAFFTPLDWHLLRHCPVPVLLLGGSGLVLPRKVVAAVEVSENESADNELNERIIKQATRLAMQCGAELHLLYACDIAADYLADMDGLTLADLTKALRNDLEQSFLRLAGQFGVPADHRHLIAGHPVTVLSEFAHEHNVDVIVMGRNQSRGLGKFLGSTTEHILYQAACSVLAV
jgi:universal stress protein E